jgi:hypothetical protein
MGTGIFQDASFIADEEKRLQDILPLELSNPGFPI